MINFPILDQLHVEGYGLFPGEENGEPGLHIQFQPGLTLILGANGLGKTTIVTILYRMLTGPYDIRGSFDSTNLGNINLQPTPLSASRKAILRERVLDGAKNATGRLCLTIGGHAVVIERRLSDLTLRRLVVDQRDLDVDELGSFQVELPKLVNVWSFGDWILLLRHLVFYFENRRALIWDASAQRQILRFLFLDADTARKWTQDERTILELDSRTRNLGAVVYREERALATVQVKVNASADVQAELETLEEMQRVDTEKRQELDDELLESDARRQTARLRSMRADQERETRYRKVERARLTAIQARFPQQSDTARYILAQLMSESRCLVCGNQAPAVAMALEHRIAQDQCVICGSDVSLAAQHVSPAALADLRVDKATIELNEIEPEVAEAQQQLEEYEKTHDVLRTAIARLNADVTVRSVRINDLIERLPPEEVELRRQRSELLSMRSRADIMEHDLTEKRKAFGAFIAEESRAIAEHSDAITTTFERYAEGFLLEHCGLAWSPKSARVGQTGESIDFPCFALDMTGADFPSPVRREGPDQVSESQREFIDLAFRMALIEVTGSNGAGSLLIDAPESSLDAVFVGRAASVLARFANQSHDNRLVITSNLVDGRLIPELLSQASQPAEPLARLVNLFTIAEPTAAIRQFRGQYDEILDRLLHRMRLHDDVATTLSRDDSYVRD